MFFRIECRSDFAIAAAPADRGAARMKLKIASYNIHKGVSAFGRRARIHDIKYAIEKLDADLVFLQEVQGQHDHHALRHAHWPQQAQHDFLAGDTHYSAYGMNAVYEHGHHGNALLSRFEIASVQNHDVSDHAFEQRGILHAVIQLSGQDVHCFVIHLGLFAVSRRRQIQALIRQIRQHLPPGAPLIIAGDFNDWNGRLSATLYQELAVTEAFDSQLPQGLMAKLMKQNHARTFPARMPWLPLDRVYVRGFRVAQAQVLSGPPWAGLSDHVPLSVHLELEPAPPCAK
jgi:endonuclease/exonuclease/phosphatase family metal-dependent hydrolase